MAEIKILDAPPVNTVFDIDLFDFKINILPERFRFLHSHNYDNEIRRAFFYPVWAEVFLFGIDQKGNGFITDVFIRIEFEDLGKFEYILEWERFLSYYAEKNFNRFMIDLVYNSFKEYAIKKLIKNG